MVPRRRLNSVVRGPVYKAPADNLSARHTRGHTSPRFLGDARGLLFGLIRWLFDGQLRFPDHPARAAVQLKDLRSDK